MVPPYSEPGESSRDEGTPSQKVDAPCPSGLDVRAFTQLTGESGESGFDRLISRERSKPSAHVAVFVTARL